MEKMSFYVYILHCSDDSYYTGHTDNLEARIEAHRQGIQDTRLAVGPFSEFFCRGVCSRQEAFERERQIKGWRRLKKEALIKQDWGSMKKLAKTRTL